MKKLLFGASALLASSFISGSVQAAVTCPVIGAANGCNVIITLNPGGTGSITPGPAAGQPYDGIEDTLVGIENLSGQTVGRITLSGPNIFGFDGDGINVYGFNFGPTGYEGPLNTFSVSFGSVGDVIFGGGLANGASTYFALEENLSAASFTVTGVTPGVPEPSTWAMMLIGFAGLAMASSRRRSAVAA